MPDNPYTYRHSTLRALPPRLNTVTSGRTLNRNCLTKPSPQLMYRRLSFDNSNSPYV